MSQEIEKLVNAQKKAIASRPKIGGFPVFADSLHSDGITRNVWHLPSCHSTYFANFGTVVQQGNPLFVGAEVVPEFDREALIVALRRDQRGEGTFPEFLESAWRAGVVSYEVDFAARTCVYFGANGEQYLEEYSLPGALDE